MATSTVCALFVLELCLPSGLIDCDLGQRVSSSVEAQATECRCVAKSPRVLIAAAPVVFLTPYKIPASD